MDTTTVDVRHQVMRGIHITPTIGKPYCVSHRVSRNISSIMRGKRSLEMFFRVMGWARMGFQYLAGVSARAKSGVVCTLSSLMLSLPPFVVSEWSSTAVSQHASRKERVLLEATLRLDGVHRPSFRGRGEAGRRRVVSPNRLLEGWQAPQWR